MKIQINNLTKKYNDKIVFNDYTSTLQIDNILFVKGVSGLGKTTLIKMIAGLEKPTKGEINVPTKNISFMFQEDRLIPYISVLKNLTLVSNEQIALKYLELMELLDEKDSFPLSLSGGMKRRISLARALCFKSDLVILDEPFKGLDENLKEKMFNIIKEESKSRCFIIVSHDSSDIKKIGGKILDLDK